MHEVSRLLVSLIEDLYVLKLDSWLRYLYRKGLTETLTEGM